jgi:hypothetical protein
MTEPITIIYLNEVPMDNIDDGFIDLTDDEIRGLPTGPLRRLAEAVVTDNEWLRERIAILPLDDRIVATGGTLAQMDTMIQTLTYVYADRAPVVYRRYGCVEMWVFQSDESLVQRLIYIRDVQRTLRDQ